MYSAELEKLKREKEEWKKKALRLEDQASALQVNDDPPAPSRAHTSTASIQPENIVMKVNKTILVPPPDPDPHQS